jgi:hypothetical protein
LFWNILLIIITSAKQICRPLLLVIISLLIIHPFPFPPQFFCSLLLGCFRHCRSGHFYEGWDLPFNWGEIDRGTKKPNQGILGVGGGEEPTRCKGEGKGDGGTPFK